MKQMYIECNMGAAGDMLMAALYAICPDQAGFLNKMETLGLPGIQIHANRTEKNGITGYSMNVLVHGESETPCEPDTGVKIQRREHTHTHPHIHTHDHEHTHTHSHAHEHIHIHDQIKHHSHSNLASIREWIGQANVSDKVKADTLAVFSVIAQAEGTVHGTTMENVHFHEVGTLDALADILGCCLLMEMIAPEKVICSPVHIGSGQVRCSHGVLPVPAPATALILQGVPIYSGEIRGELCTPTGAALLKYFADDFGGLPAMILENIGYGFGKKDFPALNCVRVMTGTAGGSATRVVEISCNIDDMTGEALAMALETLMDNGALDAFFTPIQMKKNRPAVMLTCLCTPETQENLSVLMLKHTSTLGVRKTICERTVLSWKIIEKDTPYGTIRVKHSGGYGIEKIKPEFDDVYNAAMKTGASFNTVYQAALRQDE
jgi:uncharacterized protein (TIGR00299 family) protein